MVNFLKYAFCYTPIVLVILGTLVGILCGLHFATSVIFALFGIPMYWFWLILVFLLWFLMALYFKDEWMV